MSEEDTCEPSMIGFRLFWILVACRFFSRESNFIRFRLIYDRKFESFLGVKLSAEETVCVIVKHFYIDFQLIMDLSRKCSDFIILFKKDWKQPPKRTFERLIHFHPTTKIIGKVKNACLKLSYSRSVAFKLFSKFFPAKNHKNEQNSRFFHSI